ncbi:hypothetical protein NW761_010337 [Fusarium oxysporum]|nr:hypothetical protein NW758_008896 [Fusarium oxysporum]KAJ4081792.1 hypothetical protein NW761_010337 [Fusarium oxysporum]
MDSRNTKLLAYSGSGSGGGVCNQKKNELGTNVPSVQLQKYCCDVHNEDIRFEDCQIMKDVGPFPDKPGLSPYYCRSGCPPDRIRVAMDTEVEPCSYAKIGGWAFCCKSSFGYKKRNQNPKVTAIKDVIRHWANEPTCPNKRSDLDKRSSSPEGISANTTTDIELFSRADTGSIDIDDILGDILSRTGSPDILDAAETSWDNLVEPVFPELTIKNIKRYLGVGSRWENEGPRASANRIVCNPHSSSAWIVVLKERADGGGGGGGGGGGKVERGPWEDKFWNLPECTFEVNALYVACTHANFEAVKTLIDCRGAEVDILDGLWQRDSRVSLPLHWVTRSDLPKESFEYSNAVVRDKAQSIANIVELLFDLDPTIINVTDND